MLGSRLTNRLLALALLIAASGITCRGGDDGSALRILTARAIHTMEPAHPVVTAVAIEDGRIVAVGDLDAVKTAVAGRDFVLDERLADKVLLPGFVDPHIHPSLAATILPMEIVSAMQWETPRGRTRAVRGRDAFLARLRELDRAMGDDDDWLLVWGYHRPYHGDLTRSDLDAVSTTRPILVWQRSVHEMFVSSRALDEVGLEETDFDAHPQADWATGHIWEAGLFDLGAPFVRMLAAPSSYRAGLAMMSEILHRGGLTTVGEQGFRRSAYSASSQCCTSRCGGTTRRIASCWCRTRSS